MKSFIVTFPDTTTETIAAATVLFVGNRIEFRDAHDALIVAFAGGEWKRVRAA